MKIIVDQDVCTGAASCVAIAMKTFALNDGNRVHLVNAAGDAVIGSMGDVVEAIVQPSMDERDLIVLAAQSCPVMAIKLFEDDGTEIQL